MSFESKSIGALVGAAVGSVVGALVLAAVISVDRAVSLHATSTVQPALTSATMPLRVAQARTLAGAQYATSQRSVAYSAAEQAAMPAPQGTAVYSWAFVAFAAVAGAVNGLFLMNQNRVNMAAATGRREALLAGVAAAGMTAGPAFAAYGDAANVFGKPKDVEQFYTAKGDGWSVLVPGKWSVSKEREFSGMAARWEDSFDAVNNAFVLVRPGKELGSLEQVRDELVSSLLGQQAFDGPSISEGGFAPGRYSSATVKDMQQETRNGKVAYTYEVLTRTADGNEGGRRHNFVVTSSNGKLYVYKTQAGNKRYMNIENALKASLASFTVA